MNTHRFPLLLASLLLAACSNVVITDGGSGETSSVGGNTDMGATGGSGIGGSAGAGPVEPTEPTLPAIALTRAQQDVLWDQYWSTHGSSDSSGGTGGGPDLDPNDLFLRVSDQGVSCGSPTTDLSCSHWELTVIMSPAVQQVGVYDLESPDLPLFGIMEEKSAPSPSEPNVCSHWGLGPTDSGTIEILSIDTTAVHFRVTITSKLWDFNPSGDYTAPWCP